VAPREVLARLRRGVAKPQVKLLIGVSDPYRLWRADVIERWAENGRSRCHQTGMAEFERASRLPRREAPSARTASDWREAGVWQPANYSVPSSPTGRVVGEEVSSRQAVALGGQIGVEIGDQLALTLPSTVHIDTDGLDPARSNMTGAAGGSPDALIAITASFDSQNVTIRHVPSSARKRDDSMNPGGSSASVAPFQAERRSSCLVPSTEPSTIVTNIESPPESRLTKRSMRQYVGSTRPTRVLGS